MGVVEFSAHLYPVTRVGFDAVEQGRSSNLAIRIALLRSHDLPPEIKSEPRTFGPSCRNARGSPTASSSARRRPR